MFQTGDEADLGVDLEALKAVDDAAARRFQTLRPVDVVLLVKAGAQLDEYQHFLAVFRREAEGVDQFGFLGQAVDGDLDGGDAGIVGGAAHEAQKRLHALVGVGQKHVPPAGEVEETAAHELRREGPVAEALFHVLIELLAETVDVAHGEGRFGGVDLRPREAELFREDAKEEVVEQLRALQAHGRQAAALLDQFFHLLAEIAGGGELLVLGADVGVAGDAEDVARKHRVGGEGLFGIAADDIFQMHVADALPRQKQQRGQRRRHGDQAHDGALFLLQLHRHMRHLVGHEGEGMVIVHDLRRKHRQHAGAPVIVDEYGVVALEFVDAQVGDAIGAQGVFHLAEVAVALFVERFHGVVDALQLLRGGQPGLVVDLVVPVEGHIVEAAHAHHEELVEIAGEDGDELQPFIERHFVGIRLFQYALVEFQPRKLPVLSVRKACHADPPGLTLVSARGALALL